MAFLFNNTLISSHLRSSSQKTDGALAQSRRGFHVELGAREKALFAEDATLRRFKSHKKGVHRLKRGGSLGGSATLAARKCMMSLGRDTGEIQEGLHEIQEEFLELHDDLHNKFRFQDDFHKYSGYW